MTTAVRPAGALPDPGVRWLPARLQSRAALLRLALASVVANVVIVVTGGAVRLTNSGLGCPTWPRCTDDSLTPTHKLGIHGTIEFTNRTLTYVLVIIAVATWLVAMARRQERTPATLAVLGIPAQAVVGGITVLTDLNPWLVGLHFLLSAAMIAVTFVLWWRLRIDPPAGPAQPAAAALAWVTAGVAAAVLVFGTIVTGAGPHAGDLDKGKVHRNGLDVSAMSQLHADAVMVLIGVTVGLLAVAYALRAAPAVRRSVGVLLGIELAQGAVGYTQYFLDVPPLLVGLHMLGACLVWVATLAVLMTMRGRSASTHDDHVFPPRGRWHARSGPTG